jgi:anti-sigma B factor antagonist
MTCHQLSSMTAISQQLHLCVSVAAGPRALIAVSGELDIVSMPAFAAALADLDLDTAHYVVLDLGQVEFIDTVGIHALLALHMACIASSSTLTIIPGPRHVQRVFELTGTDRQLPFHSC